jgi:hypothetical protein
LAVPAVAVAAIGEPDPIFAAIEKARATDKTFMSRCLYEGDFEEAPAPDDHRTPEMAALVTVGVMRAGNWRKWCPPHWPD